MKGCIGEGLDWQQYFTPVLCLIVQDHNKGILVTSILSILVGKLYVARSRLCLIYPERIPLLSLLEFGVLM